MLSRGVWFARNFNVVYFHLTNGPQFVFNLWAQGLGLV